MHPRLAIVTPCYGHPDLMQQALYSVLDQVDAPSFKIFVINDGCPFPRTHDFGRLLERQWPEKVIYLATKNGGLGNARNRAIDLVLADEPDIDWLFFLDADNCMTPGFLKNAWNAMADAPNLDWYYFSKVPLGGTLGYDHSGEYSFTEHAVWSVCDAGSFVSRKIPEAGIRFYTNLPQGYEDWHFFLSAYSKGFRGAHINNPGFLYRERPASMVTSVNAKKETVLLAIREQLGKKVQYENLIIEETKVTPRWAFVNADDQSFSYFCDPREIGRRATFKQGMQELINARIANSRAHFPAYLLVGSGAAWDTMMKSGLLNWLLWWHEGKLDQGPQVWWYEGKLNQGPEVSAVRVRRGSSSRIHVDTNVLRLSREMNDNFDIFVLRSDCLVKSALAGKYFQGWNEYLEALERTIVVDIDVPSEAGAGMHAAQELDDVMDGIFVQLQDHIRKDPGLSFDPEDSYPLLDRRQSERFVRSILQCAPVYSWVKRGRRSVGIVLPFAEVGGVERIAMNTAKVLKEHQFDVHLLITWKNEAFIPSEFMPYLDTINFLDDATAGTWRAKGGYFGSRPSSFSYAGDQARLVGLLSHVDVLLNHHASAVQGVLGELRRRGVKTISAQQVIDRTREGHWVGHPYEAVAFEHAYDRILAPSNHLTDWLVGHGIPREKILLTPNCPSFQIPDALTKPRQRPHPGGPLKVLFMGRSDYQKGIDRLTEIVRATRLLALPLEWRIIGPTDEADLMKLLRVERFKQNSEEICEALVWADVMVLPSRFEGVPLTMLEAMAVGCVVVATDVGGVAEFLNEETGFVVSDGPEVVAGFVSVLSDLSRDDEMLRVKSCAAQTYAAQFSWERSLTPLLGFLERD